MTLQTPSATAIQAIVPTPLQARGFGAVLGIVQDPRLQNVLYERRLKIQSEDWLINQGWSTNCVNAQPSTPFPNHSTDQDDYFAGDEVREYDEGVPETIADINLWCTEGREDGYDFQEFAEKVANYGCPDDVYKICNSGWHMYQHSWLYRRRRALGVEIARREQDRRRIGLVLDLRGFDVRYPRDRWTYAIRVAVTPQSVDQAVDGIGRTINAYQDVDLRTASLAEDYYGPDEITFESLGEGVLAVFWNTEDGLGETPISLTAIPGFVTTGIALLAFDAALSSPPAWLEIPYEYDDSQLRTSQLLNTTLPAHAGDCGEVNSHTDQDWFVVEGAGGRELSTATAGTLSAALDITR